MPRHPLYTLIIVLLISLISCGGSSTFKIKGTLTDGRTMNLRIVYAGDERLNNVLTAAREGAFEFEGQAPAHGALVQILDNDYRTVAELFVRNGDDIKLTVDSKNNTVKVHGNKESERWVKWLDDNAPVLKKHSPAETNAAIARYVKAHPEDIVSTLLILTRFDAAADAAGADSLLASIEPEARPAALVDMRLMVDSRLAPGSSDKLPAITYLSDKDTIATFSPRKKRRTLLAFSSSYTGRRDSIIPRLREVHELPPRDSLGILDFWLDTDTITWRRSLRSDSVKWPAAWAAGSVAAPGISRLGIPAIPYFIVVGKDGRQIYRGRSLSVAVDSLKAK